MNISKIKELGDKISMLENDMENDQLWGTRDGFVTAEQLIEYAKEYPYILEIALQIAKELR